MTNQQLKKLTERVPHSEERVSTLGITLVYQIFEDKMLKGIQTIVLS